MTTIRYVSPSGNNSYSGQASGQAWATLAYAQQQLRDLIAAVPYDDIVLVLAAGRHALTSQLDFTEADSPVYPGRLTFRAASGASPVISGGVVVDTWTLHDAPNNIWVADFTGDEFRQLYVNEIRCYRSRRIGGLEASTQTGTGFTTTDDATDFENLQDVEIIFRTAWRESKVKVESAVSGTSLTLQQPAYARAYQQGDGAVYAVDNAYEILESEAAAATFYLDRTADKIYLIPPASIVDPNEAEVIVPQVETLARLNGASNIHFPGIQWSHSGWIPEDGGYADIQSMIIQIEATPYVQWIDNLGRSVPGAIELYDCENVSFDGGIITQVGTHGIMILDNCERVSVVGALIYDVGGHGVVIGRTENQYQHSTPSRILIDNCLFAYCGQDMKGTAGVFCPYMRDSVISHSDFYMLPYSGIGDGWGWGYTRTHNISPNINNKIINNFVNQVMLEMFDGGGIYVNGVQHNLLIDGNYIRNNVNGLGATYMDAGTYETTMRNNLAGEGTLYWLHSNLAFGDLVIENNHHKAPVQSFFTPYSEVPSSLIRKIPGAVEWTPTAATLYDPANPTTAQASIIANAGRQTAYRTTVPIIDGLPPEGSYEALMTFVNAELGLYWQMQETSGTTAADSSSEGRAGTVGASVTVNQAGPTAWLPKSYLFTKDATSNCIATIATEPAISDITLSGWFKPTVEVDGYSALSCLTISGLDRILHGFAGDGSMTFGWEGDAPEYSWSSGVNLGNGTWYHLAVVITPTAATLYVNGVLAATQTNTSPAKSAITGGTFRVGEDSYNPTYRKIAGYIAGVAWHRRALTAGEIATIYAGPTS